MLSTELRWCLVIVYVAAQLLLQCKIKVDEMIFFFNLYSRKLVNIMDNIKIEADKAL